MTPELVIVSLWVFLFGACIGSFCNVIAARLPQEGAFFEDQRSHCPRCFQTLAWRDLIPVVSFVLRKGKCRSCKLPISPRYPAVELGCALLALLCLFRFGPSLQALLVFGVLVILTAIALIDNDHMIIPDTLLIALAPPAIAAVWVLPETTPLSAGIGLIAISLPMLLLTLMIKDAFGGGDIKLMAICGLMLGWQSVVLAFFLGVLTGGFAAIYVLIRYGKSRGKHIAFGPHLCFGIAAALLWGREIIDFYLSFYR